MTSNDAICFEKSMYLINEMMISTIQKYIVEHRKSLDKDNPNNMLDRFLTHFEKEENKDEETNNCYSGKKFYSFLSMNTLYNLA